LGGGGPDNPAVRRFYFSWPYHILPYMEQKPLYDVVGSIDQMTDINTVTGGAGLLTTMDRTPVPAYYCPARRSAQLYHNDGICDYGGNTGTTLNDGVIVQNAAVNYVIVRIQSITDGTSNVLMVGERRINLQTMFTGNDCYDNEPCVRPAGDCDVLRRAQPSGGSWLTPAFDVNDNGPLTAASCGYFGGQGLCQFGSSHQAGMFAALADGSVRRIGYNIDPLTFKNLCVRNDGAPVSLLD